MEKEASMSTKPSVKGDVNDVASVLVVATLSRTRLGNKRGDVVATSARALRNGAKGDGVASGTFGDGVAWWSGVVAWWLGLGWQPDPSLLRAPHL
ncbi:hypothetical protein DEO72_LG3g636 [Vigna unguiculata]|uniref:Uncharacterized protein n=1 Tax=Vigna unguiculata TaxID=3917 RepID=A0A4D6LCN2_VIGUN|nr:hypothetical protein DEO72_LG3g636 [Vigna unguiculata]